jgi:glucose-1-phosphate adenylyltransferase
MNRQVITVILAGGAGTRLDPLTRDRAKPAVPFCGIYRIIDFSLANCFNSFFRRILVLAQYAPASLVHHVEREWLPLFRGPGDSLIPVSPTHRSLGEKEFSSTANAVFQNWDRIASKKYHAKDILILSGDHVYTMAYGSFLEWHRAQQSAFTMCVTTVPIEVAANELGVLRVNEQNEVVEMVEKPSLENVPCIPGQPDVCLVSMGIYAGNIEQLGKILAADALDTTSSHDFGKDIIRKIIDAKLPIYAYPYTLNEMSGPWWDVGRIRSYYEVSTSMLERVPRIDLGNPDWPIGACMPSARIFGSSFDHVSIAPGVCVDDVSSISWSSVGYGVQVRKGAVLHGCHIFGGTEDGITEIGEYANLNRVICDKDVHIPPYTVIGFDRDKDAHWFRIEPLDNGEWVTVIPKGYDFCKRL